MAQDVTINGWMKLAHTVRAVRQERGLSQSELATRAQVARSWLARVEAGHRSVELEPLLRLLAELELELTLRPRPSSAAPAPPASSLGATRRAAWGLASPETRKQVSHE